MSWILIMVLIMLLFFAVSGLWVMSIKYRRLTSNLRELKGSLERFKGLIEGVL